MNRYPQRSDGHGSLKDIQILINKHPFVLTKAIKMKLDIQSSEIDWVSPLEEDDYAEYRDNGFLHKLGINHLKVPLNAYWPSRGPQWDALGKGNNGEVFLVEAKANIPEIVSQGSGAEGKSLRLIQKSLKKTKSYLKINNKIDWSGPFYQYTNRLAHLYFLRGLNEIPAYLIFVYFIGDISVDGPKSDTEWCAALTVMEKYLGVGNHRLSKFIADVFIEV